MQNKSPTSIAFSFPLFFIYLFIYFCLKANAFNLENAWKTSKNVAPLLWTFIQLFGRKINRWKSVPTKRPCNYEGRRRRDHRIVFLSSVQQLHM